MFGGGITDLVTAIIPSGSVTTDSDGVLRYTLSDSDIRRVRNALLGALPDPSKPGRPLFRFSRMDEAVVPAIVERYGLYLAVGAGALVGLGFLIGRRWY
jgi:hypothetical protein